MYDYIAARNRDMPQVSTAAFSILCAAYLPKLNSVGWIGQALRVIRGF